MEECCSAFVTTAATLGVAMLSMRAEAQRVSVTSADWPLHNLNLAGTWFSSLDRIIRRTQLCSAMAFSYGIIDGVSNQTTLVVVDGTMYITEPRGNVYAVDAAEGRLLWTFDVTKLIGARSCVMGGIDRYIFQMAASDIRTALSTWPTGSFRSPSMRKQQTDFRLRQNGQAP